jgi:uncharacterized protein (TIGR02246 family)
MPRVMIGLSSLLLGSFTTAAYADYANDRAEIENLSARYFIAMDSHDADTYAATFVPDGELVYAGGDDHGRQQIHDTIANWNNARSSAPPGPSRPRLQHSITNEVIDVTGDTAIQVAYWTAHTNATPQKDVQVLYFGHYLDHLVKVKGHWFFKKREIFNESLANRRQLFYPELGETDPNKK